MVLHLFRKYIISESEEVKFNKSYPIENIH